VRGGRLTIHSSRRRFAARLNSGVRHHGEIMKQLLFLVLLLFVFPAAASEPRLSPDAPQDKPASVAPGQMDSFEAAIAPYIAQAKSTYPQARAKFLGGLPKGQHFFVTTRLYDNTGAFEQVFIAVISIQDG